MKITLVSYNEHSILNNGFARTANAVILVIIIVSAFGQGLNLPGDDLLLLPRLACFIIATAASIITYVFLNMIVRKTTFYEWDYTERKKKHRFTMSYALICMFISSLMMIGIMICVYYLPHVLYESKLLAAMFVFIPLFLLFNILNIPSLYYSIFEDDLKLAYKIQKKPEHWKEDGKEIQPEDEINEIMNRDWGTNY